MISGYGKVRAEGYTHTLKALEKDIDTLRADLKGLSKSIKSGTKEHYADLAAWFKDATRDIKAKEKISGAMESVKASSLIAASKAKSGVTHRPFLSILTAVAVGVGVVMLVRRKHV